MSGGPFSRDFYPTFVTELGDELTQTGSVVFIYFRFGGTGFDKVWDRVEKIL